MNIDSSSNEPLIFDHIKGEVRRGRIVSWDNDAADLDEMLQRNRKYREEIQHLRMKLGVLADFIEQNCQGVEVIGRDSGAWTIVT